MRGSERKRGGGGKEKESAQKEVCGVEVSKVGRGQKDRAKWPRSKGGKIKVSQVDDHREWMRETDG